MDVRICDECVGLCCSVLAASAGETDKIRQQSAADISDDRVAAIFEALARKGPPPQPTQPRGEEFHCSFCDRPRRDVAHLVSGPRVFICDACVGAAVAVVKREPHG